MADGSEYIMQFPPENSSLTDVESYLNLTPADYNIDALKDSQVIL